ncbi:MAG: glucarate dehydratase, partial [Eubacteriales bacterium]|nr:glucarate dehydratase [Eubacteriales bacterium]
MTPSIVKMEVYPVAGRDCMELNLSGAHAPYFTRNIVILTDSNGVEGVGEVPGGQKITAALEAVKDIVVGSRLADYKQTLNKIRAWLDANIKDDVRGLQTFDLRTGVHVVTAVEAPLLDLMGKFLDVPAAALMGDGIQRERVRFLSYLFYIGDQTKTDLPYFSEPDSDCDWYRLRHQEAMTPEAIVALAKATHE